MVLTVARSRSNRNLKRVFGDSCFIDCFTRFTANFDRLEEKKKLKRESGRRMILNHFVSQRKHSEKSLLPLHSRGESASAMPLSPRHGVFPSLCLP